MPSQCSMASTVVAFTVAPLSPCSTGLLGLACTPSARAVRRARGAACSAAVAVVHLPADDLAAEQVQDEVQVEPTSLHLGGQEGHIPAPHVAGRAGHVRGRRPGRAGEDGRGRGGSSGRGRAARDGSWTRWRYRRPRRPGQGRCARAACRRSAARWPRSRSAPAPPRSRRAAAGPLGIGPAIRPTCAGGRSPGIASAAGCATSMTGQGTERTSQARAGGAGPRDGVQAGSGDLPGGSCVLALVEDRRKFF